MATRKSGKKRVKSKTRVRNKKTTKKAAGKARSSTQKKRRSVSRASSRRLPAAQGARGESTDQQGLSRRERADSESVSELLDEGNAFEAGVVAGVEEAEDRDETEVHTREVPEDDVPGEYLDKDE